MKVRPMSYSYWQTLQPELPRHSSFRAVCCLPPLTADLSPEAVLPLHYLLFNKATGSVVTPRQFPDEIVTDVKLRPHHYAYRVYRYVFNVVRIHLT